MTSRMLFIWSPLSHMPARSALRIKRVFSTCALVGVTAIYLDHKSTSACANDEPFTANTGLKSAETSDNEGKKHDYDRKEPEKNPVVDALIDFFSRLGFSGLMGVCSGYAAKRLSNDLMFVGGLVFGTAQIFAYFG